MLLVFVFTLQEHVVKAEVFIYVRITKTSEASED